MKKKVKLIKKLCSTMIIMLTLAIFPLHADGYQVLSDNDPNEQNEIYSIIAPSHSTPYSNSL